MRVSSDMPDDVIVMHDALEALQKHKPGEPLTLYLKNCGTALRFLEVHLAKCYPGEPITLTGEPRLMERKGAPTSQTTSALLMHGIQSTEYRVQNTDSPYVEMTRRVIASYPNVRLEADWSAAAFWYEYVAIHGGELLLEGLTDKSIQGDRIVADIYAQYFGVETTFIPEGALIKSTEYRIQNTDRITIDFSNCPDLYPAVALTCERLGIELQATGTERLRYKESDRLEAVRLHEVRDDHRMAMALMAAGYEVSEKDQACIRKSYPTFGVQITEYRIQTISHITPIKGVNDDNLGKKHALSKLIHAAKSEYIWLHDDDVVLPKAVTIGHWSLVIGHWDLVILPLKMESESNRPSLLEKLQMAEYAAIQELTMRTAKKGRAVMCSGANMIVKRDVWLECEKDIHPEIPSGDDMFLLEAVKRRGYKVGVIDTPEYTAVVRPQTSWRAFFKQRMRWAGKAPKYSDRDIRRCGALIMVANILQILCPAIILIKFPIEFSLIKKREPQTSWLVALILEIVYPFYILICLIGGLIRKTW